MSDDRRTDVREQLRQLREERQELKQLRLETKEQRAELEAERQAQKRELDAAKAELAAEKRKLNFMKAEANFSVTEEMIADLEDMDVREEEIRQPGKIVFRVKPNMVLVKMEPDEEGNTVFAVFENPRFFAQKMAQELINLSNPSDPDRMAKAAATLAKAYKALSKKKPSKVLEIMKAVEEELILQDVDPEMYLPNLGQGTPESPKVPEEEVEDSETDVDDADYEDDDDDDDDEE